MALVTRSRALFPLKSNHRLCSVRNWLKPRWERKFPRELQRKWDAREAKIDERCNKIIGVEEVIHNWVEPPPYYDPFKKVPTRPEDHPDWHEQVCFTATPQSNLLEGSRQAEWLTKTKIMDTKLPQRLEDLVGQVRIPNQDEAVRLSVLKSNWYDLVKENIRMMEPDYQRRSYTQLQELLTLCSRISHRFHSLQERSQVNNYQITTTWRRGEEFIQASGKPGILVTSKWPLEPIVMDREEIEATRDYQLPDFHPISPTIDLEQHHIYNPATNTTGFSGNYPYPHAHTLFLRYNNLAFPQAHALMMIYAFANCLSRARYLYGPVETDLETPIVTQCIGTNSHKISYLVFQLNTLDLGQDQGIKNMAWIAADELYTLYYPNRTAHKKFCSVEQIHPETFDKFLALYLHGA